MKRRVVITGLGIVSPLGCQVEECWQRVRDGESGIHTVTVIDVSDLKITFGGDVPDFDCSNHLDQHTRNRIDRFAQFAMVAGIDAMRHAAVDTSGDTSRFGVVLGSGIGGLCTIEEQVVRLNSKGPGRVSPMTIPKLMLNAGGGNLAIEFGLKGINYSVATACASAANAMGNAFEHIRSGLCDLVLTGGAEAALTRIGVSAFQNMRALSSFAGDPRQASRPFDAERDGFVFAEGAGLLVFEELEFAQRRGANILAEVVGFGSTCDAGHITSPDETGSGAAAAMAAAIKDGGLQPSDIDYINAHGTSTPQGDKAETVAVKTVFGDHARKLAISSTKSQLGHSLGASGGLELIITIMAIRDSVVPPTINLTNPDPECDLDYVPNVARPMNIRYAMSNSFGFGGHNASIIIKKFE
ncbi:MAG: beta-ketoacyl-ACP synthase II [Pirellulaceae bacterium]|jgi:3-oxoacyl-[acyl-carrier-protein] synthase II|nr:beta-ketoacyl-ACP synthase II [Pirellulaceae bacterium]